MQKLHIIDQIKRSSDLLSMPQTISELLSEMERPDFSADKLGAIILKDSALTGRILRLANSPFYHRYNQITNVAQAVQILGMTTVKCLALSSALLNPESMKNASGVDPQQFFSCVLTVAAAAEKIAGKINYPSPDEAFIAGLLHHIGIQFFLMHYPKQYRGVTDRQTSAQTYIDAERQLFGIDHAEVGFHLASKWNLPDYVCISIRDHQSFSNRRPSDTIQNIIRLASLLATDPLNRYEADLEERVTKISELATLLRLSREDVDELTASLLVDALKVAEYLDIDIGSNEEVLQRANQEIWNSYLMIENLFRERQELTDKLLQEERAKGAILSKNVAIATLSHYLNNATMAVYGRAQIWRRQLDKGDTDSIVDQLPNSIKVIEQSIKKVKAVLEEIRDISPMDDTNFYSMSQALNLDEKIAQRMELMDEESGLVLPEEALQTG
jgi:HD-like signal output (HDOD) protein